MNDDLVTLITYWSPVDARLAMNCLQDAGIKVAMADELSATGLFLGNAIGGIKLLVREMDVDRALAALHTDRMNSKKDTGYQTYKNSDGFAHNIILFSDKSLT